MRNRTLGAMVCAGAIALVALPAVAAGPIRPLADPTFEYIASRDVRTASVVRPAHATSPTELQRLAESFAAALGAPALPRASQLARLPGELAAQLTPVLGALVECAQASRAAGTAAETVRPSAPALAKIRGCASRLDGAAASLAAWMRANPDPLPSVDVWPLVRIEGRGTPTLYTNDYALIVDVGGDDRYFNNAGGNLIDLLRSSSGTSIRIVGPARGCQNIPDLAEGRCVVGAALLIDRAGNDVYGRLESPDEDALFVNALDGTVHRCTGDLVVRRIVTVGAGLAGVGMLLDEGGDDRYVGKTISQGAGHAGGVGILRDLGGGDDSYLAIRSSQGFGLVDGWGLLRDDGGDDTYRYYMPHGGVISDKGVCDANQRNTQGTGLIGGAGLLLDDAGDDSYVALAAAQGYGGVGGFGLLWDGAGADDYAGYPGHADGVRIDPSAESTGLFMDDS